MQMITLSISFILSISTLLCSAALQKYNTLKITKTAVAAVLSRCNLCYLSDILRATENLEISELISAKSWTSRDAGSSTEILHYLVLKCFFCSNSDSLTVSVSRERLNPESYIEIPFCLTKLQHVHSQSHVFLPP